MKKYLFFIILIISNLLTLGADENKLIDFKLIDQEGIFHQKEDYSGNVLIVIASDKAGMEYSRQWGTTFRETFKDYREQNRLQIIAVADGRGLPFFLKKLVRRSFPKDIISLMDWKGIFTGSYDCRAEMANIMLFSPSGELLYKFSATEIVLAKLQQITVQVDKMINSLTIYQ